jgi:hypothetical protein
MRKLTEFEQANAMYLSEKDIEFSFLLPTATGLGKSIMDAVSPLRDYLFRKGIHNYAEQTQGPDNKVCFDAVVVGAVNVCSSVASLYRPNTKKGDPRIWFSRLSSQVAPNEMLAIVARGKVLYALNLSSTLYQLRESMDEGFSSIISELRPTREVGGIASELLAKMRRIAQAGFIPAECAGDTAIGRTLESALGLVINSSPLPDYKGIEIKSKRRESNTRKALFAKVPDWDISSLKSFREFLDAYGYERNGLRRLNCTVSALQRNSQGLELAVDYGLNLLLENGKKENQLQNRILVWTLSALQEKLLEKHKETFWVSAETRKVAGREEFFFKSVEYTRSPHSYQFSDLLAMGLITVDHLIKAKGMSAHERGPLFKVSKVGFPLLFPSPIKFDLMQ